MKRAHRLGMGTVIGDKFFDNLEVLRKYSNVIDEVAIFVSKSHHGYTEIEEIQRWCDILKERIPMIKEAGIKSVGINVLNTIGHADDNAGVFAMPPMQTMVGINGEVSTACLCISTPEYDKYLREIYTAYAGVNPDFIWTDDDIRHWNHGFAAQHCFCPSCIAQFNERYGKNYDFDSLTAELKSEKYHDSLLWKDWMDFIYKEYKQLCGKIEEIVHSVNPHIIMGYMGGIYTEIPERITALGAEKCRPGGGVYNDDMPNEILTKAFSIARQTGGYPENVNDVQYEYENFPCQRLTKSAKFSELECSLAMMSGCNGVAYCSVEPGGFIRQDILDLTDRMHPYWTAISNESWGLKSRGYYVSDFLSFKKFAEIGIPLADRMENADAFILTRENCELYIDRYASDEGLKKILSKNIFMDGDVLEYFLKRGLGEYIGVKVNKKNDCGGKKEVFTNDPINGEYAGYLRDAATGFYRTQEHILTLLLTDEKCRVLCTMEDTLGKDCGICMTAYENSLGGKIVVSTYLYPDMMKTPEKRGQMFNIMQWLSGKDMPVKIGNCCKVVPIIRGNDKKEVIMFYNASMDDCKNMKVTFANPAVSTELICEDGKRLSLVADAKSMEIDCVYAFSTYVIVRKLED